MDNVIGRPFNTLIIKIILYMYWLFGFQILKYSHNEISNKGLKRKIYPAIIISVYLFFAGIRIKTRDSDSAPSMVILLIVDISVEIVEASVIVVSIILECFYADKKAQLYTNLNQAYNEIYESEHFKSTAINRILAVYVIYLAGYSFQIILCKYAANELGLLCYFIIIIRNLSVGFMILQNVVEIYFCTLGFYSLNESLCNFGRDNPFFSKRSQEIDFQSIDIFHKYYHIEWFEKTVKNKNGANLQNILNVYNILLGSVDLVILRFGILVSL